jgi:hypothetical protein
MEALEPARPQWRRGVRQIWRLLEERSFLGRQREGFARNRGARFDNQIHLCSELDVYLTDVEGFGWDCGYRNLQMMISALVRPMSTIGSAGYALPASAPWRSGQVPSILGLQRALEEAWSCGFDPESCRQFQGRIQHSCQWIGAIDAAAVLSYWGVEARLVDSDPRQSAQTSGPHPALVHWIWDYFEKRCRSAGGCIACRNLANSEHVLEDSHWRASTWTHQLPKDRESLPPLFLQYAGHSVTVIGVMHDTKSLDMQIVVLDPNRQSPAKGLYIDRRSVWELMAPQYQLLYIGESIRWDQRIPLAQRQIPASLRLT